MSFLLVGASQNVWTYIAPHTHSLYEIAVVTEGEGISVIGGVEYSFRVGTVFIIPPNVTHTSHSDEGYREIYIQTDQPIPLPSGHLGRGVICLEDDGERSLMRMMLHRYIQGKKNDTTLSLMYELVTGLLAEKCAALQTDPVVEDVRRLLALSYNDPQLSLSELLESTGYHKDHVRRRFIAVCGVTPCEYLTELRLENAKRLLKRKKEMRLSIADIGAMCGYYDAHYFSRVFKKHLGVTPESFAVE